MAKCWRMIVAAAVLSGAGCCHNCGCCDCWSGRADRPPPQHFNEGPQPLGVPPRAPAGDPIPPVGPRPGLGAYGGS